MNNKKLGLLGFVAALASFGIQVLTGAIADKKQKLLIEEEVAKALSEKKES